MKYKQQRRIFTTRLRREKLLKLHNSVAAHMVPGEDGVMILDEDSIDLPKRTAVNSGGNDGDARVIDNDSSDDDEPVPTDDFEEEFDSEDELLLEEDQAIERLINQEDVVDDVVVDVPGQTGTS
ncbi:hypothetical protein BD770DRAFT_411330 [Pilaira anomala]|nr:hypothetical protein BD770DRAFT_411330 [Pilaira anomala]